jgi:hypothetical protein
MTDAERIAALSQQVTYWRNQAATLNQRLQATRNTPERHHSLAATTTSCTLMQAVVASW